MNKTGIGFRLFYITVYIRITGGRLSTFCYMHYLKKSGKIHYSKPRRGES
jgi:hypothetical protein